MKKLLFVLTLALALFTSCKKDEEKNDKFAYPLTDLYGTWDATELYSGGKWIDVTKYPYDKFAMAIKFNSDGTFSGWGYFGSGSGTYEAKGKTITTYISGKVYFKYHVVTFDSKNGKAELKMQYTSGDVMPIRVKRR